MKVSKQKELWQNEAKFVLPYAAIAACQVELAPQSMHPDCAILGGSGAPHQSMYSRHNCCTVVTTFHVLSDLVTPYSL